ncbi:MAG: L-seryl-tRNA(Sec) selenium transferase [Pyrinomonadaceae bacterium]
MTEEKKPSQALRALPSVDALLRTETARTLLETAGAQHLTNLARAVTEEMRAELQAFDSNVEQTNGDHSREALLVEAARRLERACRQETEKGLRRVINASGVILHTNLGRAPLSQAARRAISEEAARYCTLEYDLETGTRGRRGARVEKLLSELTGAEDALVVNNCAAAALLTLTVLARDFETIISRGEMVEIGGDFRVPDVMAQSGATMIEIGTTNRTRIADYERAINERTRLIMRVHPSNYRIVGFTATPALKELAALAREHHLLLYEDAGSGALVDLSTRGLNGEPVISESIADGADVVTFSGDKLLGASQAGLIVGRRELIEKLRRSPLYRALRADKLALSALEATLDAHRRGAAFAEIPTLRMLSLSYEEMQQRAKSFLKRFEKLLKRSGQENGARSLHYEIKEGHSAIGGGSAPTTHPPTALIALSHSALSAVELEQRLRRSTPPIITRIAENKVLIDLRTVAEDEEQEMLEGIKEVLSTEC